MSLALPYLQVDQLPPLDTMETLIERSLRIPGVRWRQSRMASPASLALFLGDDLALGPAEAFIDQHEFCHLHPLPEGGIHLTLPQVLRDEMVRLGWGERHPIAKGGAMTSLVVVYAPRDRYELDTVFHIVVQSCQYAKGELQALHGGYRSLDEQ